MTLGRCSAIRTASDTSVGAHVRGELPADDPAGIGGSTKRERGRGMVVRLLAALPLALLRGDARETPAKDERQARPAGRL